MSQSLFRLAKGRVTHKQVAMEAKQLYLIKEAKSHIRMAGKVYVRAHRRRNGSHVKEHWRRAPTKRFSMHRQFDTTSVQLILFENNDTSS